MLFFSFGNRAFNKEYSESNIYIIISPKQSHESPFQFLEKAIEFIDEKIYPGEDFKSDYAGIKLIEGNYENIVMKWISSMSQSIEICFDDIQNVHRIKCNNSDPYRDEFLIETNEEYIIFLWSTTA